MYERITTTRNYPPLSLEQDKEIREIFRQVEELPMPVQMVMYAMMQGSHTVKETWRVLWLTLNKWGCKSVSPQTVTAKDALCNALVVREGGPCDFALHMRFAACEVLRKRCHTLDPDPVRLDMSSIQLEYALRFVKTFAAQMQGAYTVEGFLDFTGEIKLGSRQFQQSQD